MSKVTYLEVTKKGDGEVHVHRAGHPDEVVYISRSARDCNSIASFLRGLRMYPIPRRLKKYLLECLINDVDA